MMLGKRTNEWVESARSGIIVPLLKIGDRKSFNIYRGWRKGCRSGLNGWVCWMTTRLVSGLLCLQQT